MIKKHYKQYKHMGISLLFAKNTKYLMDFRVSNINRVQDMANMASQGCNLFEMWTHSFVCKVQVPLMFKC